MRPAQHQHDDGQAGEGEERVVAERLVQRNQVSQRVGEPVVGGHGQADGHNGQDDSPSDGARLGAGHNLCQTALERLQVFARVPLQRHTCNSFGSFNKLLRFLYINKIKLKITRMDKWKKKLCICVCCCQNKRDSHFLKSSRNCSVFAILRCYTYCSGRSRCLSDSGLNWTWSLVRRPTSWAG